jgi:hypothetical protein
VTLHRVARPILGRTSTGRVCAIRGTECRATATLFFAFSKENACSQKNHLLQLVQDCT